MLAHKFCLIWSFVENGDIRHKRHAQNHSEFQVWNVKFQKKNLTTFIFVNLSIKS